MKQTAALLACALLVGCAAPTGDSQPTRTLEGEVRLDGATLALRDAHVLWRPDERVAHLFLLPLRFEPGTLALAADPARWRQALRRLPSPDPERWAHCPFVELTLRMRYLDPPLTAHHVEGVVLRFARFTDPKTTVSMEGSRHRFRERLLRFRVEDLVEGATVDLRFEASAATVGIDYSDYALRVEGEATLHLPAPSP